MLNSWAPTCRSHLIQDLFPECLFAGLLFVPLECGFVGDLAGGKLSPRLH